MLVSDSVRQVVAVATSLFELPLATSAVSRYPSAPETVGVAGRGRVQAGLTRSDGRGYGRASLNRHAAEGPDPEGNDCNGGGRQRVTIHLRGLLFFGYSVGGSIRFSKRLPLDFSRSRTAEIDPDPESSSAVNQ